MRCSKPRHRASQTLVQCPLPLHATPTHPTLQEPPGFRPNPLRAPAAEAPIDRRQAGTPRARNCGPRARLLLLLLLLLLSLACSCCCCCCCSTHPPWRTPTSRGHIRVTRGLEPLRALVRAPPCTHNFGTRALATAWSGAGEPRLSERIWSRRCSGDRQTWAASKRFEDDASCETEESEAAGADSTKGRREAQRGL